MLNVGIAAVLETMWGETGDAPGWFRINPRNFTGRRLHYLTGQSTVWVTNACPQQVGHAQLHGTPDPEWLAGNLRRLSYKVLLVCGKVAQATYQRCGYQPKCKIVEIPHPAARNWTKEDLDMWRGILTGSSL